MDINYSKLCNHDHIKRIDKNFIKCLDCGQSIINQSSLPRNKTPIDFVNENKIPQSFSNKIFSHVSYDENRNIIPKYEYYRDRNNLNEIIINWADHLYTRPIKFKTIVNSENNYLTKNEIKQLLFDVRAHRVNV